MALLLVTNPPSTLTLSSQWGDLVERSDKNMLGFGANFGAFTLTNWDSSTLRPQIAAGSIVEVGGSFYQADSDTAIVDESGLANGTVHIKLIVAGGGASVTPTFTYDSLPAWDANKVGWYTGTTKYMQHELYISESIYTSKAEYTNQSATNKTFIGSSAAEYEVLYVDKIVQPLQSKMTKQGNSLTLPAFDVQHMFALSDVLCGYYERQASSVLGRLIMYIWDGTDWAQSGNDLDTSSLFNRVWSISVINKTDIAISYRDQGTSTERLQTYNWDGTDFTAVGNALTTGVQFSSMAPLNDNEICVDGLAIYAFDGTDWSLSLASSISNVAKITPLSNNKVLCEITAISDNDFQIYEYNGTSWESYGTTQTITTDPIEIDGLTTISSNEIVYIENSYVGTTTGVIDLYKLRYESGTWRTEHSASNIAGTTSIAYGVIGMTTSRVALTYINGSTRKMETWEYSNDEFPVTPPFQRAE